MTKAKIENIDAQKISEEMIKIVEQKEQEIEDAEKQRLIAAAEEADKNNNPETREVLTEEQRKLENWTPKTELGRLVSSGKIKNLDEILDAGKKILESEITDSLISLQVELLNIGQAKGKFGGGKRRSWRQTQKKTQEGNVVTFSVLAVVGDGNGHVGIGFGRASETLPAKEKAIRDAKINIMRIKRGCASFDCSCEELHSIPFQTFGKCSSVEVKLIPAPQVTGLVVADEIKKILKLAGIKDVYGRAAGKTRTTLNVAKATIEALKKLGELKE
jgi:small subunit ribosomal protein S5